MEPLLWQESPGETFKIEVKAIALWRWTMTGKGPRVITVPTPFLPRFGSSVVVVKLSSNNHSFLPIDDPKLPAQSSSKCFFRARGPRSKGDVG